MAGAEARRAAPAAGSGLGLAGAGWGLAAGWATGGEGAGIWTGSDRVLTTGVGEESRLATFLTSTAPAVTIAAAAMPAAALEASALAPAEIAPPAAAVPAAPVARPAPPASPPAPEPPAPEAAPVPKPSLAMPSFLRITTRPTGYTAASALLVLRNSERKVRQRSQDFRWRRTGAVVRVSPSATWPSSIRTSSQVRSRASAASASPTRARTRRDFTLGTVVSIASAIWS